MTVRAAWLVRVVLAARLWLASQDLCLCRKKSPEDFWGHDPRALSKWGLPSPSVRRGTFLHSYVQSQWRRSPTHTSSSCPPACPEPRGALVGSAPSHQEPERSKGPRVLLPPYIRSSTRERLGSLGGFSSLLLILLGQFVSGDSHGEQGERPKGPTGHIGMPGRLSC